MKITNNIGYLINHLAFILGRQSNQVLLESLGIGLSQFKILMVLKWSPSVKQKDIASRLGQTEASVSRQIGLLHDKGFLKTIVRPENRRQHITVLTPRGETIIDESLSRLDDYYSPVLQELTPQQQATLIELLGIMHSKVCAEVSSCACSDLAN